MSKWKKYTAKSRKKPRMRAHEIRERRQKITELARQGYRQWEIAEMIDVRQGTVTNDLKIMEAIWIKSGMLDVHLIKLRQLNKLDEMEQIAIQRLEALAKDPRSGSRWLEERRKIIERRCRILGLDAPKQVDVSIEIGETKEQRDAAVKAAQAAMDAENDVIDVEAETTAIEHTPGETIEYDGESSEGSLKKLYADGSV
jgi:DNA-binding CsgD family transcriptional regulator